MKEISLSDIVAKMVGCLDDAREILDLRRTEPVLNRSYYAMFHGVQALLFTINLPAKSHTGAHNAFHKEFILTGLIERRLGLALKRTFGKRQFSDYEYDEVSYKDALESFEDAEYFVKGIINYLKENDYLK